MIRGGVGLVKGQGEKKGCSRLREQRGLPKAHESTMPHMANPGKHQSLKPEVQFLPNVHSFHGIVKSKNCGSKDGSKSRTVCICC